MVEFVVAMVIENRDAAYGMSRFVHRTASLVSEKECGLGMLIKWKPLRVQPEAFVHLQGRHPLRDIFVNGKRQGEEIPHVLFVFEIELNNVHKK